MIWYLVAEFVHIAAVVVWMGGALLLVSVGQIGLLFRAGDLVDQVVHVLAFAVTRIFVPTTLVVTLSGLYMVWQRGLAFDAWLVWGLAGIVISGIIGAATLGPIAETAAELLDDEVTRADGLVQAQRLLNYAAADMSVLITILYAMVLRPEWSDTGSLAGMAAFMAAAVAWALTRKPVSGLD